MDALGLSTRLPAELWRSTTGTSYSSYDSLGRGFEIPAQPAGVIPHSFNSNQPGQLGKGRDVLGLEFGLLRVGPSDTRVRTSYSKSQVRMGSGLTDQCHHPALDLSPFHLSLSTAGRQSNSHRQQRTFFDSQSSIDKRFRNMNVLVHKIQYDSSMQTNDSRTSQALNRKFTLKVDCNERRP